MSQAAVQLESWSRILSNIRQRCTDQQYRTWFSRLSPSRFSPERLEILVPNRFLRDWLAQNYLGVIQESTRYVTGADPEITIRVDESSEAPADPLPAPTVALPKPTPTAAVAAPPPNAPSTPSAGQEIRLNVNYTFENFIVGTSNRLPHAAALAVVASPGTAYNPLFLHGSVGLGKTHLLQAICHALVRNRKIRRFHYISCETFVNHFISAIEAGKLDEFRHRYRNAEMLLVDDVQFLANKEKTQEEFFHTFNSLYHAQSQIVFTCDSPPSEMRSIEQRLVSRFNWGLVAHLELPDFETRVAILNKKANLLQFDLPEGVAHFVAEQVNSNIRDLEGAINRIIGFARLLDRPVDLELARDAFRDLLDRRPSSITMEALADTVSSHFALRRADLQSKSRQKSVSLPRQICMFLARRHTSLSLGEIGRFFGGRDHTTVLYATDKVTSAVARDPEMRRLVQTIEGKIRR